MMGDDDVRGVRVRDLRANWTLVEDGELAQKLQSQEIENHLAQNKTKNSQIRDDYPKAYYEQKREELEAARERDEYRKNLNVQEREDAELARRMFRETQEQRKYESTRDHIFAKRIQNLEKQHQRKREGNQLLNTSNNSSSSRSSTPPLFMSSDGDIYMPPGAVGGAEATFTQGGVTYNDAEYKIKLARPAMVKAEPVYANNRPEHYAVSAQYPNGGKTRTFDASSVDLACAAGLLSQADIALSQKAEAMLEQQKKDEELAKQLQEELEITNDESKDLELALALQEKEKAKLRRAKERSKAKKQAAVTAALANDPDCIVTDPDQRSSKRPESANSGRHSRNSRHGRSFDEESLHPPARKPYVNTAAIDNCPTTINNETVEPYYANIPPPSSSDCSQQHILKVEITRHSSVLDDEDIPVPPYMPMQHSVSKKSTSMEKKLAKKKEKEGCKQQ